MFTKLKALVCIWGFAKNVPGDVKPISEALLQGERQDKYLMSWSAMGTDYQVTLV
jgi:hypothetical protein